MTRAKQRSYFVFLVHLCVQFVKYLVCTFVKYLVYTFVKYLVCTFMNVLLRYNIAFLLLQILCDSGRHLNRNRAT